MQRQHSIFVFLLLIPFVFFAQNNKIGIDATLIDDQKVLIQQEIEFFNRSDLALDTLYLLNWANGYKDRETPLSKRLLEDYKKEFYFSNKKDRGYSEVRAMQINGEQAFFQEVPGASDLLFARLNEKLKPGESLRINLLYEVRLPNSKFTGYGFDGQNFNLRYWYITPAVFNGKWNLYSNLNMDDYFMDPTDYSIDFRIPLGYQLHADLQSEPSIHEDFVHYHLEGKNRLDIELNIQLNNEFSSYPTEGPEIITNLRSKNLTENIKGDVIQRQLDFIETYLGPYPHDYMMINRTTYLKHPVYGFNQLPKRMNPFSDIFEYDIKMFKALTDHYIENTILTNKRKDAWLPDGIQIYLMMEYVSKFYPEVKAIGKISKKWGIRRYNLAKLDFNEKYPFVVQFSTRKNLDQALNVSSDSLSNINLKLVNRYKSGLGLKYLDVYLQGNTLKNSLKSFYEQHAGKFSSGEQFNDILRSQVTDKDLSWFFNDYLRSEKKIDYTIDKVKRKGDSLDVTLRNKSNINSPIALYGVDKKEVKFKEWIDGFEGRKKVRVSAKDIDRLSLNYEYLYPEANLRDNWEKLDKKLLNRPLKFTFYRDVEDPYYNQVFYKPFIGYNFYDGLLLGPTLYNQALFKKKWLFSVTPVYGFKSNSLTGSAGVAYEILPEETSIYRFRAGLSASRSHYDEDLAFNKITPFARLDFKRKSLRDVGGKSLMARYVVVDKDLPVENVNPETYKYNVFNVRYGSSKPEIINDLRYFADFQYNSNFSKLSFDLRYRKLTSIKRYLDFRAYFGYFLFNDTTTDFFSFALDRPSDYLFDLNYLGRSEDSGFLSQEIIITEGGFKSIFEDPYANEWIATTNFSVGVWRWVELYADAGLLKNQGEDARFKYDSGIRLNFVHNFLELYFPLQSSLGFEPGFSDYASRIRFVLTIDPERIYNLIKRGFY